MCFTAEKKKTLDVVTVFLIHPPPPNICLLAENAASECFGVFCTKIVWGGGGKAFFFLGNRQHTQAVKAKCTSYSRVKPILRSRPPEQQQKQSHMRWKSCDHQLFGLCDGENSAAIQKQNASADNCVIYIYFISFFTSVHVFIV